MRLELTPRHRISLIALQIIVLILLPIWFLKLLHYLCFPMPFFFASPSTIPNQKDPALQKWKQVDLSETLKNTLYFVIFWIQHIVMALFKFKTFFTKLFPTFAFYQRAIYNLISSVLVFYVIDFQVPQNYILFELPWLICAPLSLLGLYLLADSNLQLSIKETHAGLYSFKALIQDKYLEEHEVDRREEKGIYLTGSYRWIRHPMQFGSFLLVFFANNVFSFERCVSCGFLLVCIFLGVVFEEKRLVKKYSQYTEYMKQVPNRFVPYIF